MKKPPRVTTPGRPYQIQTLRAQMYFNFQILPYPCRPGVVTYPKNWVFSPEKAEVCSAGGTTSMHQIVPLYSSIVPNSRGFMRCKGILIPQTGLRFPCSVLPPCRPEFFRYVWGMLTVVPIFQRQAKEFIATYHRHHKPSVGSVFNLALSDGEKIVGVCMVGRPVARLLNDGLTLEVTRLCTEGTKNACSMLYAAAWRVAKNMGYKRLITYILASEPGVTLRAAGFTEIGLSGGGKWSRPSRERARQTTEQMKIRYQRVA